MRFEDVHIDAVTHVLPERAVTSDDLETRLAPAYERLSLSRGRLELMSGIRERRFWTRGTQPSDGAARAGAAAIEASAVDRARIGCLVHAAVSRDFLEPSTASVVHARLELPTACTVFDLSNACLGFVNAVAVVASMIAREEIEAGLIVASEDGEPLVEQTIENLLAAARASSDRELRGAMKRAYASLTIGAGAAAMVLTHRSLARETHRVLGGRTMAATEHHTLCRGDRVAGSSGLSMDTDSEALLAAGNALATRTWTEFLRELDWRSSDVSRVITHQVGAAHRRTLLESLQLDPTLDFPTYERLGNIGSVSLPLSLSLAAREGFVRAGDSVALLGIGSGLHCAMLGVEW